MEELQEKRWLTAEDLADYLSIKKSTVYDWIHRKAIPHYKRGHVVRFRQDEVDNWLENFKVEPASDLREEGLENGNSV